MTDFDFIWRKQDEITAEKTTKRGERVSRVFDHVISKCVLGYKVQILCVSDGTTTIPVDFSIHREKGGDGSWGLTAGELRKQFRKKRKKESPSMEILMEADRSKLDVAVEMIRRAQHDLEHHCHHGYDNEFHEGIRDIPGTLGHRGADKGLPPELGIRQMPVK